MDNSKELKDNILKLSFELEQQYDLNFKHHCYLRIAYDTTVRDKWNNVIKSPFLNNCTYDNLINVFGLLLCYQINQKILLYDNEISLGYRNKINQ